MFARTRMAVYLFTIHAYSSWLPDRRQGYTVKNEGVLPQDLEAAERYRDNARHEPVVFRQDHQQIIVNATIEICQEKEWRLHQVRAVESHFHILVSWKGFQEWKEVRTVFKRRIAAELSKGLNCRGLWFSKEGSRKRVEEQQHFDYLMSVYLPRHGGCYWREDEVRGN